MLGTKIVKNDKKIVKEPSIRKSIPKHMLKVGEPVATNVLRYCAEHGSHHGIYMLKPVKIILNQKEFTYQQAKSIPTTKDMEITLEQE